jgi:superfamily II RNA helicase
MSIREKTKFFKRFPSKEVSELRNKLKAHPIMKEDTRIRSLSMMTCLVHPIFEGGSFFDLLDLTNLGEGDLIRFFSQLLDRLNQILKAAEDDELRVRMERLKALVDESMKDISRV